MTEGVSYLGTVKDTAVEKVCKGRWELTGDNISRWVGIQDDSGIGKRTLSASFWGAGTTEYARKLVVNARCSRLVTRDNPCRWLKCHDNPKCTLCHTWDDESRAHMLLGCTHYKVYTHHITRHTWVVHELVSRYGA